METQSPTKSFETKPCTRCGGSGHYSYCSTHGTRCFGCGGKGWQYTKRGAAAQAFYAASLCIPARDVHPGMMIRIPGLAGIAATRWLRVERIEADVHRSKAHDADEWTETPAVQILGQSRLAGRKDWTLTEDYGYGVSADTPVRVEQTADDKRAKVAAALAYQDTLTQAAKPRK